MARQEQVTLIDDMDGGKADETVTFALDGVTYEIDLHKKKASALRKALDEFLSHARPMREAAASARVRSGSRVAASRAVTATAAGSRSRRRAAASDAQEAAADNGSTSASAEATPAQIRQWASAEGIAVSERGRVSDSVRQQYLAAHQ